MRPRPLSAVLVTAALLGASACGGGGGRTPAPAVTWTGARALTGVEDGPSGVATDGTQVWFTAGRTQAGEQALRVAPLAGPATSHVVAAMPGGLGPNRRIALDAGSVYVAAGSAVVRLPAAGGEATVVVKGRPALVEDVVVTAADLWWTTYQLGEPNRIEVARMPKAGGPVQVAAAGVASGLGRPYPDGDSALLASPGGVLRVRAGAKPEVVVSTEAAGGVVSRLAMDDQRLYVSTTGARNHLVAIPRGGGPAVELADHVDPEADLAVVGGQVVFFSLVGGVGSGGRAVVQAVPGAGGPVRTIASGSYPDGDLAAVGSDRVVFSADSRVWVATVAA